jgi:hypothetical protein
MHVCLPGLAYSDVLPAAAPVVVIDTNFEACVSFRAVAMCGCAIVKAFLERHSVARNLETWPSPPNWIELAVSRSPQDDITRAARRSDNFAHVPRPNPGRCKPGASRVSVAATAGARGRSICKARTPCNEAGTPAGRTVLPWIEISARPAGCSSQCYNRFVNRRKRASPFFCNA